MSNCHATERREYVEELKEYIDISVLHVDFAVIREVVPQDDTPPFAMPG